MNYVSVIITRIEDNRIEEPTTDGYCTAVTTRLIKRALIVRTEKFSGANKARHQRAVARIPCTITCIKSAISKNYRRGA